MRVVYERCCGLDVHKTSVVACVLIWSRTRVHIASSSPSDAMRRRLTDFTDSCAREALEVLDALITDLTA
jgi:hypothetical protein